MTPPHQIAPKLGQVSYPTLRSAVPSPSTNNKNSSPTPGGEGEEGTRGLLGFVVSPPSFVGELARIWDHISQEAVREEGGAEGGLGDYLPAATWEA